MDFIDVDVYNLLACKTLHRHNHLFYKQAISKTRAQHAHKQDKDGLVNQYTYARPRSSISTLRKADKRAGRSLLDLDDENWDLVVR